MMFQSGADIRLEIDADGNVEMHCYFGGHVTVYPPEFAKRLGEQLARVAALSLAGARSTAAGEHRTFCPPLRRVK